LNSGFRGNTTEHRKFLKVCPFSFLQFKRNRTLGRYHSCCD